jgi:hypothetical protein
MATVSEVFDAIALDVEKAHIQAGDDLATELKYKVSVPVQYVAGPRGGTRVIRSLPGEPPRKETGRLQASINHETVAAGDVVETAITAAAPYAARLQEQMNRPITDGESDAVERLFIDPVANAING